MKIPNYGEYEKGELRGYHPPACTCFDCNEVRIALEAAAAEERRMDEYERRLAGVQERRQSRTTRRKRKSMLTKIAVRVLLPALLVAIPVLAYVFA